MFVRPAFQETLGMTGIADHCFSHSRIATPSRPSPEGSAGCVSAVHYLL